MRWKSAMEWAPRILCILAILFISMFSLDAFDSRHTFGEQLLAFLIHNIPSLVLALVLVIAWKWRMIGGFIFVLLGLAFSPVVFTINYRRNHSIGMSVVIILAITFPFIITGVMFIISHYLKKREQNLSPSPP